MNDSENRTDHADQKPLLNRLGESADGNGIYEMNTVDIWIYMRGAKQVMEEIDDE